MRSPRKLYPTAADKVRGNPVKYKRGDCLSIKVNNGYLAAIITEKFNKYYDLTLIEYYKEIKPDIKVIERGRFFGTRFNSWEELEYGADRRMVECVYIDSSEHVECVGYLNISALLKKASYGYEATIEDIERYYIEETPIRQEKTKNAEKFPDLAFVSKHLIEIIHIVN